MTITFYHDSSLGRAMGVSPAGHALDGFTWLRIARGQETGPDWADTREATRKARLHLRLAKHFQRHRQPRRAVRS